MSDSNANPSPHKRDPDLAGAEAAMHRAAQRAGQRAQEAANSVTLKRAGILPNTPVGAAHDGYSFSQAHGYEEIPGPLNLEELPKRVRTRIWNLFFVHLDKAKSTDQRDRLPTPDEFAVLSLGPWIVGDWREIARAKHDRFDDGRLDEWEAGFQYICRSFRNSIETPEFNKVFDLIQFVLRHPRCPRQFITDMKRTFSECRLAYTIDVGPRPTIVPAVTPEEGTAIVQALQTLREGGLESSAAHLREAAACINRGEWAGSVRESIHAVESVARQLDPKAAKTLGSALKSIERRGALHPALKKAFGELYGYTSGEQGIRHALLDQTKARVGQDEAVFMLGACASFASYLWRKHAGTVSS